MVDKIYSIDELRNINSCIEDLLVNIDDATLNELLGGKEKDIDKIFETIADETYKVINLGSTNINIASFDYLQNVTMSLEEVYRKSSLNFFVINTLPHFDIQWFHIEWFNFIQLYRLLSVLAPRGHGKSYSFSYAVPLWKMYRYRRPNSIQNRISREIQLCKEGMIISNKYDFAKDLLRKIKNEIECNDIIGKVLMPRQKSDGWGAEGLIAANGAEIGLSSFGTSNRGPHPGWIMVDDFLDKSCLYSNQQREKFAEVFFAEIMNMLLPDGQITVVGTPFHQQDLYGKLKEDERFKVFEYPAIMPNGRVLYPERFPFSELIHLKQTFGTLIFSREYLVRPVTDDSTIFPWEILQKSFIGMESVTYVQNIYSYPIRFKKVCVGCDFAKSGNIGADYTVYAVCGMDAMNNYHIIHIWRKKGASHNEQIAELTRINNNFKPDRVILETNGFQEVMLELAKQNGIKAEGHVTTGHNKKDMYEGVPALAILFERGQMRMPRGDEKSRATTDLICSEFNSITFTDKGKLQASSEHDDTVMAIFFAIRSLTNVSDKINISFV